jgi:hypothetical protein
MKIQTETELVERLNALGEVTDEQKRDVVCSLIGHSRIQTHCFGYYYCARCNAQVGDSLGSIYPGAERAVIVGHKCPTCEKNFAECTWHDKFMCPDPFAEEPATEEAK